MDGFKIYGMCAGCKRNRWFVRKATVKFPVGKLTATSKDLMCGPHIRMARAKIK